jgi:hypothetical protein
MSHYAMKISGSICCSLIKPKQLPLCELILVISIEELLKSKEDLSTPNSKFLIRDSAYSMNNNTIIFAIAI